MSPPLRPCRLPVLCLAIASGSALSTTDGTALLFASGQGTMPESARRQIYELLGLEPAPQGGGLRFRDMRDCGPVETHVRLVDLNNDGTPEVRVLGGNACFSGEAGSHVWLFVADPAGQYRLNLGFPASDLTVLPSRSHGFADLKIEGPGFCRPIWRWNGMSYQLLRLQAESPGTTCPGP